MPIYTYRCDNCDIQFDRFQKFSEQSLTRCPECGKKTLRKVYSPVGIVFKGSGFYSTDNRSPSGQTHHAPSKSSDNEKGASDSKTSTPSSSPTTPSEKKE